MSDGPDTLLHVFRETMLSEIRFDEPDLNMRQLAVALTVYRTNELQTVRGLAMDLNISKPAVTRALDGLGRFDLAQREIDRLDRRSVNVVRTQAGAAMMRRLAEAMTAARCAR